MCLNHGVHLGVCDTLYKKQPSIENKENLADTDEEKENIFADGADI